MRFGISRFRSLTLRNNAGMKERLLEVQNQVLNVYMHHIHAGSSLYVIILANKVLFLQIKWPVIGFQ